MIILLLQRQESPTDQPPGDATQASGSHGSGGSRRRSGLPQASNLFPHPTAVATFIPPSTTKTAPVT